MPAWAILEKSNGPRRKPYQEWAVLSASGQVWPAFVLVTGLLLIGVSAEADGLFAAAGSRIAQLPAGPNGLYVASLGLVVVVTAVLNLDTSVFFLTPVLLHVARARGVDEQPFLYGAVFMSNSASLFPPGSNLTNLIVLHGHPMAGRAFLTHLLPSRWRRRDDRRVLLVWFSRRLRSARRPAPEAARARVGAGLVGVTASVLLVLALASLALPVLGVAVATAAAARVDRHRVQAAVNVPALAFSSCSRLHSARPAVRGTAPTIW